MKMYMYAAWLLKAFKTKDSYIMVGAGNNRLFDDLCQVHVVRPFILLSCVHALR